MMATILQNNMIEINILNIEDGIKLTFNNEISRYGHRYEINQVTIDGFNNSFMSLSKESIKLWDFHQNQLIKTLLISEGNIFYTSCIFVPGNRFIVVANNQGELVIYNLIDSSFVESVFAMELDESNVNNFNMGIYLTPNNVFLYKYL